MPTSDEIRKRLQSFLEGPGDSALLAEASDLRTPPARLAELARSGDEWVRLAVAKNPNAPTEVFLDIAFS